MRIKTIDFASGRTRDGRVFSAQVGAVLDADEADQDKVDLFREFVAVGVAELVETEPEPATEEDEPPKAEEPAKTEPARARKAASRAKGGAE